MIGETFNTTKLLDGIHGNLTVELRDATTDTVQEKMQATNFVAQAAIRRLKWLQRANHFKDQISVLNAPLDQDYQWPEAQSHIVLSSSTAPTNSSEEWQMFGKLAGYAGKYTYSGLDTLLGTPNSTLCEATPTYTKWVFDCPTSAVNGVIGSVGWMTLGHTYRATVGYPGRFYTSCSVQDTKSTANQYWRIARASSTQYFAVSTNSPTIFVLDQNFAQTNTFSVGSQFKAATTPNGLVWDGNSNKLWVIGINSSNAPIIASYNSSGVLQDGPSTITNRTYRGLAFDGTHLWSLANISSDNFTLYRINTSGGDVSNIAMHYPPHQLHQEKPPMR